MPSAYEGLRGPRAPAARGPAPGPADWSALPSPPPSRKPSRRMLPGARGTSRQPATRHARLSGILTRSSVAPACLSPARQDPGSRASCEFAACAAVRRIGGETALARGGSGEKVRCNGKRRAVRRVSLRAGRRAAALLARNARNHAPTPTTYPRRASFIPALPRRACRRCRRIRRTLPRGHRGSATGRPWASRTPCRSLCRSRRSSRPRRRGRRPRSCDRR